MTTWRFCEQHSDWYPQCEILHRLADREQCETPEDERR
jgi:hypothetical protein